MIELTIIGIPAPQGSKVKTRWGMREDNPNTKPWRATVAAQAAEAMTYHGDDGTSGYLPPIDIPVRIDATFIFPRPKSHYRSGKNAHLLKDGAPEWHDKKPDADKLARAIGDALTGVALRDDSQIVQWTLRKVYGEPARCELRIEDAYQEAAAEAA